MVRLKSFVDTNLWPHKVITLSTTYYYDKMMEGEIMLNIANIYK